MILPEKNTIGIYKITSPTNRIYIGQSVCIRKRFQVYLRIDDKVKEQRGLYNSLRKHGSENHIFEVIEECEFEDLNIRERYWQDYYEVLKRGLNCVLTETNEKPRIISDYQRNRIINYNKNRVFSAETRLKMSLKSRNQPCGLNHNKSKKVNIKNINNGDIFYMAINEASKFFKCSIWKIKELCSYHSEKTIGDIVYVLSMDNVCKKYKIHDSGIVLDLYTGFYYYGYNDFSEYSGIPKNAIEYHFRINKNNICERYLRV